MARGWETVQAPIDGRVAVFEQVQRFSRHSQRRRNRTDGSSRIAPIGAPDIASAPSPAVVAHGGACSLDGKTRCESGTRGAEGAR